MNIKETKRRIIQAGHKAVDELVKVAKEAIVDSGDDITADRLKNAAATKNSPYLMLLKYLIEYKKKRIFSRVKNLRRKKKEFLKDSQKEDRNELRADIS